MKQLNIGLIGYGFMGRAHSNGYRRVNNFFDLQYQPVLKAACGRNAEQVKAFASKWGYESTETDWRKLIERKDIDAIDICTPNNTHKEIALAAAKAGKMILCEKPLSMNTAEAEEMANAAKAAGLLFGVGQNFRFNHSLDWMREQVAAGQIGQPQIAHAQYAYPAKTSSRKWITDPTLACGGPIADVGVHCIDALRYVLGEDVVSVSTLARRDDTSGQVDAIASLQLEMTGGTYANVTASARAPYRTLIEIMGSDGTLVAENGLTVDRPVQLELRRAGELVETVTLENGDGYKRMLDSFARAFRGVETFAASGEDGVENMRALDAAYKSWQSGLRESV
jgi:1,5-anhydro-D-fructose reductase (1,5-anhydro-D-mannitol-forming)